MSSESGDELFFLAYELGGAGRWGEAIDLQMGRVLSAADEYERDGGPGTYHRLHYESYFLLAAVRQLLRVCRAYADVTKDDRLVKAIAEFRGAATDAVNFRNWFEHLDAYFAGTGHLQESGKVDPNATLQIMPEGDRVVLHFDGRSLDVVATKEAALQLAAVASEVWMEHFHRRAKGGRLLSRPERERPD